MCLGNVCRSQMAEGFARAYGGDVLIAASAGLAPGFDVAPDTLKAMQEKNIDLRAHFPKSVRHLGRAEFDIVVNMSGRDIALETGGTILTWDVEDPYMQKYSRHCEIRDLIERMVMDLVLQLRRDAQNPQLRTLNN